MSSNCDSDGCPIDHDGAKLEDGVFSSEVPIAVSGDVFRELFSGSGKDLSENHLEANPLGGSLVKPSALDGGIPVADNVIVEDYYSSDEPLSPKSATELCNNEMSSTIHAMLRSSRHEREALISARRKLADTLQFLRSKGFTEEHILAAQKSDGMVSGIPSRDDFGLPVVGSNPFKDKMKGKIDESKVPTAKVSNLSQPIGNKSTVYVTNPVSEGKDAKKSWANVVKSDIPDVKFQYFPLDKGATIVHPPDEVLKKGNDKFLNCIVGTFSKGTHSFKIVSEFAFHAWKSRGLLSVSQKDVSTYVFRFESKVGVNDVLSRGTWYVNRRPMLVTAWGHKPGVVNLSSMPLWVKFTNIPDCYWTDEGLSRLASVIGEPIGADPLTSKLELLPFAKLQVKYNIGDPLPNEIPVVVLDPLTATHSTAKVSVTYPFRPLSCSGCKSLGHSVSACPNTTRIWKVKEKVVEQSVHAPDNPVLNTTAGVASDPVPNVQVISGAQAENPDEGWTDVKRKKPGNLSDIEASPSPPVTFKNLRAVDEVAAKKSSFVGTAVSSQIATPVASKRLTKSQKKKLKASSGNGSPPLS